MAKLLAEDTVTEQDSSHVLLCLSGPHFNPGCPTSDCSLPWTLRELASILLFKFTAPLSHTGPEARALSGGFSASWNQGCRPD